MIFDKSSVKPLELAALLYFALVFGAGFLLGVVRVLVLEPRVGERAAELAEMPVMLTVSWLAAGFVCRRYRASLNTGGRAAIVGLMALLLLVLAETLLVAVQGRNLYEYIATRDPVAGSAYLVALGLFAAMPWIRNRLG